MPDVMVAHAVLTMRTFSQPAHRAHRRALAEQLAPAALRTRPYAHPIDEPQVDLIGDELDVAGVGPRPGEVSR